MKKIFFAGMAMAAMLAGCNSNEWDVTSDLSVDKTDPTVGLTPLAEVEGKDYAPLYWSVYGDLRQQEKEKGGVCIFTMDDWDRAIKYVADTLKAHGYDMLVTDGFASMSGDKGYMTRYSHIQPDNSSPEIELKDVVAKLKAKGLKLGIYDSPFWLHYTDANAIVPGTENIQPGGVTIGSLRYDAAKDKDVLHPNQNDQFGWCVTDHPGAEEHFKEFFRHYAEDLDVHFIRMDFLSWYEDGMNYTDIIDKGYGRERYVKGLQWIAKYAKEYGVYVSLVMPHMKNEAIMEKVAGNMIRIDADCLEGSWYRFSENNRGSLRGGWPNSENAFDGFINWSKISGRKKIRLDGDFIRMASYANDDEKRSVVSLPLMAGGPVAVTDYPNAHDAQFFTNDKILALQKDGFVGQPLQRDLWNTDGEIWYGQMKDGTWVIGLFNRSAAAETRSIDLTKIGAAGSYTAQELWDQQEDVKVTDKLEASVPAHGCKIFRLVK